MYLACTTAAVNQRTISLLVQVKRSGVMDPKAFVDCVNGRMSERRTALVLEVFDMLDTTGKGHLVLDQASRRHALAG